MKFNEDLPNVFALSLVEKPAIKSDFIYLSEEEVILSITDKEKRLVTGPALIPEFKIPRKGKNGADDYDIVFSAEDIELASQQFLKEFNQKEITQAHSTSVNDTTLVESWIKTSDTHDKSVELGLEGPVGTWFVTLKVEDDALWEDILDENVKGFSIEGKFDAEEVQIFNLKDEEIMSEQSRSKSLLTKLKDMVTPSTPTVEVEAAEIAEIHKWKMDVINEEFELGTKVTMKPYEGSEDEIVLSSGEYELEDGRKILVDGDGIIQFIKESPNAKAEVEEVVEEEVEAAEVEEEVEAKTYVDVDDYNKLVERTNELEESLAIVVEMLSPKEEEEEKVEEEVEVAATVEETEEVVETELEAEVELEAEPEMVSLTEETPAKVKAVKFDHKMTVQERIKAGLSNS